MSVFMLIVIACGFYSIARNAELSNKPATLAITRPEKPIVTKK